MKHIDVSDQVMKKIVRLEKTRTTWWTRWFMVFVTALAILAGIFLWVSIVILSEVKAWDLLTLLSEDWEIIAEFWQDTLSTFLQELPVGNLLLGLLAFIGILVAFISTKRRRAIIRFKQSQLAKKTTMSKNKDA